MFKSESMVFCTDVNPGPPMDLLGVYDALQCDRFPTQLRGFVVSSIVSLVDVHVTIAVTIESTNRRGTAQTVKAPSHLHPGPNVEVLPLYELMAAEPGPYLATLLVNGQILARRKLEVTARART